MTHVCLTHLQSFLFTLDQPAGQVCVGAGQVAQSGLQVAHFGEDTLVFATPLQLYTHTFYTEGEIFIWSPDKCVSLLTSKEMNCLYFYGSLIVMEGDRISTKKSRKNKSSKVILFWLSELSFWSPNKIWLSTCWPAQQSDSGIVHNFVISHLRRVKCVQVRMCFAEKQRQITMPPPLCARLWGRCPLSYTQHCSVSKHDGSILVSSDHTAFLPRLLWII